MKAIFISSYLFFICVTGLYAQRFDFAGLAPALSLNRPVNSKFDINFLATSKISLSEKTGKDIPYQPRTLEFYGQGLLSYAINGHWHIGGGYGFQRNNPFLANWRNEHRLVEQVIFTTHISRDMFYARARIEERWLSYPKAPDNFGTRVRFQSGYAKPLRSAKFYWQINDEVFFIPSGNRNALLAENWLYTGFGFNIKYLGHVETGIGYDSNAKAEGGFTNLLLFQVAWSWMIKSHDKSMMAPVIHNRHF